jgi:hypothetical protein
VKVVVESARNGYIVRIPTDGPDEAELVIAIGENDVVEANLQMLQEVHEAIGHVGSRHDARRIFIGVQPGDKHHDLHPKLCAECECRCDPDRSTPLPASRDV